MLLFCDIFHFHSASFMLHENWNAPESLLHAQVLWCLVSPGIAFLPGLDSNHLESRPLWQTAKWRQLELPALACPESLTAVTEEVAFLVCLLAGGLHRGKKKTLGLVSTMSGPMTRSKLRQKRRLSENRCAMFWQSCFFNLHLCRQRRGPVTSLRGLCYVLWRHVSHFHSIFNVWP